MLATLVLLAVAVAAIGLFWGSWVWMIVTIAVVVVELVALRRSERFSARVWRNVPRGRRRRQERATETAYVLSAVAGVVLFVIAFVMLVAG
jgi:hypothetical protein